MFEIGEMILQIANAIGCNMKSSGVTPPNAMGCNIKSSGVTGILI